MFLLKGINESFSDFLHCHPIWIRVCVQMFKKMYLATFEFCENWRSESHKFLGGVNKFPIVLPTFIVSFG